MSHEERNAWLSLLANLAVTFWVAWRLSVLQGAGALDGADAAQVFGRVVVWAMLACAVLVVGAMIGFRVGHAVASGDHAAALRDERDTLFETRGMGMTMAFVAAGFVAGFVALAWGVRPVTVFIGLYFAFSLGSLAGDAVRLASYRSTC